MPVRDPPPDERIACRPEQLRRDRHIASRRTIKDSARTGTVTREAVKEAVESLNNREDT